MNKLLQAFLAPALLLAAGAARAAGPAVGETTRQGTNLTAIILFAVFVAA